MVLNLRSPKAFYESRITEEYPKGPESGTFHFMYNALAHWGILLPSPSIITFVVVTLSFGKILENNNVK